MTTISTDRLVLREFSLDDSAALHAIISLPEVVRYQTEDPTDEAGSRAVIEGIIAAQGASPRLVFDFAVIHDGALVGRVGMKRGADSRQASLWFEVAPAHHGHGYASEAARALLELAFEDVGLHRVTGDCDPRNPASARVMERIGMRREAHLVQNMFIKGEWCDSVVFAMLASDWRR